MDDLDAPQWADFIGPSPQISVDDYFLRRNIEHKYRDKLRSEDFESPNVSTKSHNFSKHPLNDASYVNESNLSKTPIKVASVKRSKSCSGRKNSIKETTYENVLMEAMSNLQLSFKKHAGDKSCNKSCLIDSPAFQKNFKRVTRSMCTDANNLSKSELNESHYVSLEEEKSFIPNQNHCKNNEHEDLFQDDHKHDPKNEVQNTNEFDNNDKENKAFENQIIEQTSQIHLEVSESSTEHEISHDRSGGESGNQVQSTDEKKDIDILKSKVVTSFISQQSGIGNGSKKKVTTLTGNAWHRLVKRRMSITNQHRLSMNKPKPTVTNKYVSMAEAVTKFHRVTPQRFHTTTVKTTRTEQLRKSLKLTRAISPALTCKNRVRPVTVISREEQERLELEKVRQNKIKANPVRKDILKKPAPLKKVEKKMVTNPEPFHLTQTKKEQQAPTKQSQEIKRTQRTKTVPSIVSTDDQSIIVQQEEILHFGIPLEPGKQKKKNTKVRPFSFEARNKELQLKKLEKLKQMQEIESQKNKAEFHARPVPAVVKTPINKLSQSNNSSGKAKVTIARSLSFEQRHKELQKKKEEKIKQLLEEEKKARIFKAQKVPEFKPVMIRGRSRDNLLKKSNENLSAKPCNDKENVRKKSQQNMIQQSNLIKRPLSIPFVAPKKLTPPSMASENQENGTQMNVPKILEPKCKFSQKSIAVLTELNTDKRAKQRKEFDEQIKRKEMEELEMRKKNEEERILQEKAQKLELRKMTEIKARPMPVYKPINIIKSNKQLTEAKSPAWTKHKGSIH